MKAKIFLPLFGISRRFALGCSLAVTAMLVILASCFYQPPESSHPLEVSQVDNANLILITLDGVRPLEFFEGIPEEKASFRQPGKDHKLFKSFWQKYADQGTILGYGQSYTSFKIATPIPLSLPSYHSMFLGAISPCQDNKCGYMGLETVFERIHKEKNWGYHDIAIFATWEPIKYAVSAFPHPPFLVNTGLAAFSPPEIKGKTDAELLRLSSEQFQDIPPWKDSRYDAYTFALARQYLRTYRPHLLYISLGDADEYAHKKDYQRYSKTIAQYDQWIDTLMQDLAALPGYGEHTSVLITSDHGRGLGEQWSEHGEHTPIAQNSWLYCKSPLTPARGVDFTTKESSLAALRPLVEILFSLKPQGEGIAKSGLANLLKDGISL